MRPITQDEIQNLQDYELSRPEFRARVIESKRRRRAALGPLMTLIFENRETVRFQIQEMLRVERIVQPAKVQHEIDTYNELLPGEGQVAATLFIEITDASRIQTVLDGFLGLEDPGHLRLRIGGTAHPALFAPGQSRDDRISAVHYIRFGVGDEGRAALSSGEPATLEVDHGDYHARQELSREAAEELIADLSDAT